MDGTPACPRGDEKKETQMKNPSVLSDTGPRLWPSCSSSFRRAGQQRCCKARRKCVPPPSAPPLFSGLASFPLLVLFVAGLAARIAVPVVGRVVEEHLVEPFEGLGEVVLQGGEGGADGGRAEAVRDEGEVGEAALDAGLQDGAGPGVAQRSPVLGQQVCELLTQLSAEDTQQDQEVAFK